MLTPGFPSFSQKLTWLEIYPDSQLLYFPLELKMLSFICPFIDTVKNSISKILLTHPLRVPVSLFLEVFQSYQYCAHSVCLCVWLHAQVHTWCDQQHRDTYVPHGVITCTGTLMYHMVWSAAQGHMWRTEHDLQKLILSFHLGFWGLNWGHKACIASPLLTETPPWPQSLISTVTLLKTCPAEAPCHHLHLRTFSTYLIWSSTAPQPGRETGNWSCVGVLRTWRLTHSVSYKTV